MADETTTCNKEFDDALSSDENWSALKTRALKSLHTEVVSKKKHFRTRLFLEWWFFMPGWLIFAFYSFDISRLFCSLWLIKTLKMASKPSSIVASSRVYWSSKMGPLVLGLQYPCSNIYSTFNEVDDEIKITSKCEVAVMESRHKQNVLLYNYFGIVNTFSVQQWKLSKYMCSECLNIHCFKYYLFVHTNVAYKNACKFN